MSTYQQAVGYCCRNSNHHHHHHHHHQYSITISAVVQHCLNNDRLSQWNKANFDTLQNRNVWTDWYKILTGDYSGRRRSKPNLVQIVHRGSWWANRWNIMFFLYFFNHLCIFYILVHDWPQSGTSQFSQRTSAVRQNSESYPASGLRQ